MYIHTICEKYLSFSLSHSSLQCETDISDAHPHIKISFCLVYIFSTLLYDAVEDTLSVFHTDAKVFCSNFHCSNASLYIYFCAFTIFRHTASHIAQYMQDYYSLSLYFSYFIRVVASILCIAESSFSFHT